jgi:hypothetical protein
VSGSDSHEIAAPDLAPAELAHGLSLLIEAMHLPAFEQGLSAPTDDKAGAAPPWAYPRQFTSDVIRSLKAAGPRAEPVVQELVKLAQSENVRLATAAVDVLGAMGQGAAAALPTLRAIIEQKEKRVGPDDDRFLETAVRAEWKISHFDSLDTPPRRVFVLPPDAPSVR